MAKRRKHPKERKKIVIFGWLFDIVDLIMNFLPGKAASLMILSILGGGYLGYGMGAASVDIPICPELTCPDLPACPEVVECPAIEECPEQEEVVCPKALEDYTCEEITEAKIGCVCDSISS